MPNFLQKLATHILALEHQKDVVIIFPNKRAGVFLKEEFKNQINQPYFLPEIYGIEDFVSRFSGLQPVSNLELMFKFHQVYRELLADKAQAFSDFLHWSQILLHDFNEIDQQLVNPIDFFSYMQDIRDLENWGRTAEGELTPLQINYNQFWVEAGRLYEALKASLLGEGMAYNGLASRVAVDKLKENQIPNLADKHFIFAGFSAMTAAEERIMEILSGDFGAEILWDADTFYVNQVEHEAGLFFRKYKKKYPKNPFNWLTTQLEKNEKKIDVVGVAQQSGQVKVAGLLLMQMQKEVEQTAVVLADENLLTPLLQSLPEQLSAVNVTMGYPLENSPFYTFFNSLIELYTSRKDEAFYHHNFLKLLRTSYFEIAIRSFGGWELIHSIESAINKRNIYFIRKQEIEELADSVDLIVKLFNIQTVSELLAYILTIIEVIRNEMLGDEKAKVQLELEYLLAFYQLFNRIQSLKTEYPFLEGFRSLHLLFQQLAKTDSVDFEGEPLEGLQVMGMLETRNVDFKNIVLLSANEGILPVGKSHNSFIPFDVKAKFNLPTHREKDAMFAYHFYHLLQGSDHITIVYNTESEGLGSGEKSRFITQIEEELSSHSNIQFSHRIVETPILSKEKHVITIQKDSQILAKIKQKIQSGLSPSSLGTYINCPLDFYYHYVLELSEENKVERDIESSTLGSAIHEVLELLYKNYEGKTVGKVELESMLEEFPLLLETVLQKEFDAMSLKSGKNLLTMKVAETYIGRFLKTELKRVEKGGSINVKAVELQIQRQFVHQSIEGELKVNIKGKLDRIDEKNGQLQIIDYKTGSLAPSELKITEIETLSEPKSSSKSLQLLTYAYLCEEVYPNRTFKSSIESFKNSKAGRMYLSVNNSELIDRDLLIEFEKVLGAIVDEMLNQNKVFKHRPESKYCKFCS